MLKSRIIPALQRENLHEREYVELSKYIIHKSQPLKGAIRINGAKNSVLPIMAAALLTEGESIIEDVPPLNDVRIMSEIISLLGAQISFDENRRIMKIGTERIIHNTPDYELVSKLRASFLVMGPLLARTGRAKTSLPGGCAIGTRPVDLHIKGFSAMGADITCSGGNVEAVVSGRLQGSRIYLDFPSVGATENLLMAAVLAKGQTLIENAASEPEVVDLATFLESMGADINGAGTDTIRVTGVESLSGTRHCIIPDRIEAGTFMTAAALTGGEITIENIVPEHLKPICAKLRESGVEISEELSSLKISAKEELKAVDIKTHPYPGFPTDMQAQMSSLLSVTCGTSMIVETIFENRFNHICELKRMGASIKIDGRSAVIEGMPHLSGAEVKACDLRAGAALVLAGMAAEGTTIVDETEHIDRGYVDLDKRLNSLGANIQKET